MFASLHGISFIKIGKIGQYLCKEEKKVSFMPWLLANWITIGNADYTQARPFKDSVRNKYCWIIIINQICKIVLERHQPVPAVRTCVQRKVGVKINVYLEEILIFLLKTLCHYLYMTYTVHHYIGQRVPGIKDAFVWAWLCNDWNRQPIIIYTGASPKCCHGN